MRKRAVAVVVIVAALVVGSAVAVWIGRQRSTFEQALGLLPQRSLRVSWTDWADVRRLAHGAGLDAGSSRHQVGAYLNRAANRDLDSGSALDTSTYALEHLFGFSPLDAQWELLGQSRSGQVDVLQLDSSVDMGGIENALRRLGYSAPAAGAGTGGTWAGSADLVARISGELTPIEQNLVVLGSRHLVLMSDDAGYVSAAADVVRGDAPSVTSVAGVPDLARIAGAPVSAVLWASTFACVDLSMGKASPADQRVGTQLVAKAGGINPLTGLVMARQGSRVIEVGMHFDTSDEATHNLQSRVDLAAGPAPGQGGGFRSRFKVTSARSRGQNVELTLTTRKGASGVLSDISQGPVLFATC